MQAVHATDAKHHPIAFSKSAYGPKRCSKEPNKHQITGSVPCPIKLL
jgi:hypothetical protein